VGYLTVNPFMNDEIYRVDFLDAQPAATVKPNFAACAISKITR
jgi:hypothetical protein